MKKTITESQLYSIIKESVAKTLNEISTELMGAAAMKANSIARNGKNISEPERVRRQRQAAKLYQGARDNFNQEHSHEGSFGTKAVMGSAMGYDGEDELKTVHYGDGGAAAFERYYDPYSKEAKYANPGRTNGSLTADGNTYYDHASRQDLRRTDKAEKDYNDLYQKAKQYGRQLDAEDL